MADGDKPYRVYKGGRVKGKVPPPPRPDRSRPAEAQLRETDDRPRWGRRIARGPRARRPLLVVRLAAGYLSVPQRRRGRERAAAEGGRGDPRAAGRSAALEAAVLILLLGTDGDRTAACRRPPLDSILLLRTEPGRHRLSYLSIPRDLRVDIPGFGPYKINAAYQLGGPR